MPTLSSKTRSAAASFAVAAALLGGAFTAARRQAQSEASQPVYVCPPCGIHCDRLAHKQPGKCPVCGMTLMDKDDLLQAAILVYGQVSTREAAGPAEVFLGGRGFFTYTVGAGEDPVFSNELFEIKPRHRVADSPLPDVLVVPGGRWGIVEDEAAIAWVRTAGRHAQHILGIGRGVVVLAKAGLLEGRQAVLDERSARFLEYSKVEAKAEFHRDRPWMQSGKVFTAVSPEAALDASLALVSQALGAGPARQAAQFVRRPMPEK